MVKGDNRYCGLVCGVTRGKITVNVTPNHLKYYVIFKVYKYFKNVATGHITQAGKPWIG